jgi:hypothetical protein
MRQRIALERSPTPALGVALRLVIALHTSAYVSMRQRIAFERSPTPALGVALRLVIAHKAATPSQSLNSALIP